LEKLIHPFQLGITGSGGKRTLFFRTEGGDTSNTLLPENSRSVSEDSSISVMTITLEDIFKKENLNHCDFLKMDCEGSEYEILFNTKPEILRKISNIFLEYHSGHSELVNFLTKFLGICSGG
jgi:FkbM family methyltransferase